MNKRSLSALAAGALLAGTRLFALSAGPAGSVVCVTDPVITTAADSGAGTLRHAIANACPGSTITTTLPARTVISLSTVAEVSYGPSALGVGVPITINGGGLIIERAASVPSLRLFFIAAAGNLTLNNVHLRDGNAQGGDGGSGGGGGGGAAGLGGAIFNEGTLTLNASTLTANAARGGAGGSAASQNHGGGGGGGLGGNGGNGESSAANGGGGGGNSGAGADATASGPGMGGNSTGGNGASSTSPIAGPGGVGGGGGGGTTGPGGAGGFGGGSGGGQGDSPTAGFGGGGGGAFSGLSHPGFGGAPGGEGAAFQGGGGAGLGGAVFNNSGTLTITNSTFSGNAAAGGSGLLAVNRGSGFGGAVFNRTGTTSITNSTLATNTVSGDSHAGGAVYSQATLNLTNSILSNTTGGSDCRNDGGTVNAPAANANLIMNNSGCGTPAGTADPALGGLLNNGGPTDTRAITTASPAFENGTCSGNADQRGFPRPGGNSANCDMGAFEIQPPATMTTQASTTGSIAVSGPVGGRVKDTAHVVGAINPTGSITFNVFGPGDTTCATSQQVSTKPFGNGDIAADDFAPSIPGTYRWTASYPGDANNPVLNSPCNALNESSDIFAQTQTTVAATPEPSVFGQPATFTATVIARGPAGTPTGTVKFVEGLTALTGDLPLTSGQASFTKSDLPAGSHVITAVYTPAGGSFFLTSTGAANHAVVAFAACTRTATGGAVTVAAGESVCVTNASITSLTVNPGGGVFLNNSRITGNATATQPRHFVVCNSSVTGSVSVSGATGLVQVGDWNNEDGFGCGPNSVAVDIVASNNTASTEISNNSVGRDVSLTGVTGRGPFPDDTAPELEANRVTRNLACSGNTPPPTNDGTPNRVQGVRSGQCTAL